LVDVVIVGPGVPVDLLIRQNLIHRRPPEVAVGDFLGVVQAEGDLANIPRINGGTVPGGDFIGERRLPVDEILPRFIVRGGRGGVDFGRDPPVEVVVGKGDGFGDGPAGVLERNARQAVAGVPGVFDAAGRFDVQKLAASPFRRPGEKALLGSFVRNGKPASAIVSGVPGIVPSCARLLQVRYTSAGSVPHSGGKYFFRHR
jgi:hypothetical protein